MLNFPNSFIQLTTRNLIFQATQILESRINKMTEIYTSGMTTLNGLANSLHAKASLDLEQMKSTMSSQISALDNVNMKEMNLIILNTAKISFYQGNVMFSNYSFSKVRFRRPRMLFAKFKVLFKSKSSYWIFLVENKKRFVHLYFHLPVVYTISLYFFYPIS